MGCGCGKKSKLPTAQPERWASLVNRSYKNTTEETLSSRNPRFSLASGDSIVLTADTISHIVRGWIRSGALELEPEVDEMEFEVPGLAESAELPVPDADPFVVAEITPAPVVRKPAAKKPVAKKPVARKPAVK